MSDDSTTQCLLFPGIFRKPIVAQFDQREGSSDGGALLLKAADRHYDLVAGLSSCLRDDRQAGGVDHSLRELVAQRVFSIACGYPDANGSARLSVDPIHKLLLDRDPIVGRDLASQPTLSRFENGVGVKELYRVGEYLADSVIRRHAKRLRHRAYCFTIDLDPTDDPTHGAQRLSFFNGHYDTWCYLPVLGFVSFNDEAERYLCAAVLRPGNVGAAVGAVAMLRRLVRMIRHHLPGVQIRVRLDGGFAHPALLQFFGRPAETGICGRDGQECSVEARRRKRNAASAQALGAQRKRPNMFTGKSATRPGSGQGFAASSSKPRSSALPRRTPKTIPRFCHHQHETESAMDLRTGLLPARGHRESDQGACTTSRSTAPVAPASGQTSFASYSPLRRTS